MAAPLINEIVTLGQALGRPVELSVFLEYSTVADLAGALGSARPVPGGRPQRSQIVTLRPGPSARSLYLVHPLGVRPRARPGVLAAHVLRRRDGSPALILAGPPRSP